jgi:phosphoribosylaminoimidazole-succinocarboxamide synthase
MTTGRTPPSSHRPERGVCPAGPGVHLLYHRRGMAQLTHVASGKVREIYEIDADHLLFVATDRISAYDVILPTRSPTRAGCSPACRCSGSSCSDTPNHLVTADLEGVLDDRRSGGAGGRAMVVRRAEVVPVECVVRGYLYGSAWREYRAGGGPTTEHLPPGSGWATGSPSRSSPPPPRRRAATTRTSPRRRPGRLLGDDLYEELRRRSIDIYLRAAEYAAGGGDPGRHQVRVRVRRGRAAPHRRGPDPRLLPVLAGRRMEPGNGPSPASTSSTCATGSTRPAGTTPRLPPDLPDEVVAGTRARYVEAYEKITGSTRSITTWRSTPREGHRQHHPPARDRRPGGRHRAGDGPSPTWGITASARCASTAPSTSRSTATSRSRCGPRSRMCEQLLANPVLEDFEVEVLP